MPLLDEWLEEAEERRIQEEYQRELARQEELERRRQEERQRRQRVQELLKRQLRERAKRQVAKKGAEVAGRAAGRAAATTIGEALAAAGAAIVDFLVAAAPVILVILIIIGIILLVLITIVVLCNQEGWTGHFARIASTAVSFVGLSDVCKAVSGLGGIATTLDRGQIPPVGGEFCPARVNLNNYLIDCSTCINLNNLGIPVKPPPATNPFVHPSMGARLQRLLAINKTFIITEAFCPTVSHSEPKHYTGKSIDMRLKDEFNNPTDKAKLAQLIRDAQGVGFVDILCEYPANFLPGFKCGGVATTQGSNIHIEEP